MVMVNGWLLVIIVIIVILVILVILVNVFPECVARVSVWLWGSGGWGCVRSTLRLRSQPSATVRNRPQPFAWGPYGRAYGKFLEVSNVSLLRYRVAGVALRDIQTCFVTCRKLFLHGRRIYFCDIFRRFVAVFVAGAALWTGPSSFCVASTAL